MANFKPLTERTRRLPRRSRPPVAVSAGIVVLVLGIWLELWRLTALTSGLASKAEVATKHSLYLDSPWWKSPAYLYGPYYSLVHASYRISHNLFGLRLLSIIIGLLSAILVYLIANNWHGYKIATLSTVSYLTGFGFLAVTRQGIPLSSQMLLIIALLSAILTVNNWDGGIALLYFIVVSIAGLYIPGGIWIVLVSWILTFADLKWSFKRIKPKYAGGLVLAGLIMLAPLTYRLTAVYSNSQLLSWLGYGLHGKLSALKQFATNFYSVPLNLFIHNMNLSRTLSLGHLPLLPAAESIVIAIGLYCYARRLNNFNWRCVSALIVVCWLMVGFGVFSVFSLLPLLALAMGAGLTYMLKQWYEIFPQNPIARQVGVGLMAIVMLFSSFYAARSYFVAWANDPSTVSQYTYHLD